MSESNNKPYHPNYPNPHSTTLKSEKIRTDRKTYYLDLKENHKGKYVQITEDDGVRRSVVVIPISAANSLESALSRLMNVA